MRVLFIPAGIALVGLALLPAAALARNDNSKMASESSTATITATTVARSSVAGGERSRSSTS